MNARMAIDRPLDKSTCRASAAQANRNAAAKTEDPNAKRATDAGMLTCARRNEIPKMAHVSAMQSRTADAEEKLVWFGAGSLKHCPRRRFDRVVPKS